MGYLDGFAVTIRQHRLFGGKQVTTEYSGGRYARKRGKGNDPTVSDDEYDRLERRLRSLEQEHPELASETSPTATVGGAVSGMATANTVPFNSVILGALVLSNNTWNRPPETVPSLAVALGIVRAHGGGIVAQSSAGYGTTMRVLLPV